MSLPPLSTMLSTFIVDMDQPSPKNHDAHFVQVSNASAVLQTRQDAQLRCRFECRRCGTRRTRAVNGPQCLNRPSGVGQGRSPNYIICIRKCSGKVDCVVSCPVSHNRGHIPTSLDGNCRPTIKQHPRAAGEHWRGPRGVERGLKLSLRHWGCCSHKRVGLVRQRDRPVIICNRSLYINNTSACRD